MALKKPRGDETPDWFGAFKSYAKGKSHSMNDIRASIANGRGAEFQHSI